MSHAITPGLYGLLRGIRPSVQLFKANDFAFPDFALATLDLLFLVNEGVTGNRNSINRSDRYKQSFRLKGKQ